MNVVKHLDRHTVTPLRWKDVAFGGALRCSQGVLGPGPFLLHQRQYTALSVSLCLRVLLPIQSQRPCSSTSRPSRLRRRVMIGTNSPALSAVVWVQPVGGEHGRGVLLGFQDFEAGRVFRVDALHLHYVAAHVWGEHRRTVVGRFPLVQGLHILKICHSPVSFLPIRRLGLHQRQPGGCRPCKSS